MASIVCDSSSLISFSETCNVEAFGFLKRNSRAKFLIPEEVRNEIFVRPLKMPRYEFSAIRLNKLLEDGVVERISVPELEARANNFLNLANNLLSVRGRPLELVQRGEAQCLAAIEAGGGKGLLIDEKTTRLLVESPGTLLDRISGEYSEKIAVDEAALAELGKKTRGITVLRSSELLAVAAGRGFFREYGSFERKALHSALLALRNAGCSITTAEIEELAQAAP